MKPQGGTQKEKKRAPVVVMVVEMEETEERAVVVVVVVVVERAAVVAGGVVTAVAVAVAVEEENIKVKSRVGRSSPVILSIIKILHKREVWFYERNIKANKGRARFQAFPFFLRWPLLHWNHLYSFSHGNGPQKFLPII